MQEAFKKVEKDAFRFAGENEKLKKTIESMQEELDNLRQDASVMRSILDRATIATPAQPAAAEKPKYVPKPFAKKAEEDVTQLSAFEEPVAEPAPEQPTATVPAANTNAGENAEVEVKPAKNTGKSRVGNMFDLLTFSDI